MSLCEWDIVRWYGVLVELPVVEPYNEGTTILKEIPNEFSARVTGVASQRLGHRICSLYPNPPDIAFSDTLNRQLPRAINK